MAEKLSVYIGRPQTVFVNECLGIGILVAMEFYASSGKSGITFEKKNIFALAGRERG